MQAKRKKKKKNILCTWYPSYMCTLSTFLYLILKVAKVFPWDQLRLDLANFSLTG